MFLLALFDIILLGRLLSTCLSLVSALLIYVILRIASWNCFPVTLGLYIMHTCICYQRVCLHEIERKISII